MLSGIRFRQKIAPLARKFAAIAHPSRVAILSMLQEEPATLPDIIRRLQASAPLVAHHLAILVGAGWVTKTKYGKLVTYYMVEDTRKEVLKFLRNVPT